MQKIFFHNNILDSGPVTKLILIKSLSFFLQKLEMMHKQSYRTANEFDQWNSPQLEKALNVSPLINSFNNKINTLRTFCIIFFPFYLPLLR